MQEGKAHLMAQIKGDLIYQIEYRLCLWDDVEKKSLWYVGLIRVELSQFQGTFGSMVSYFFILITSS